MTISFEKKGYTFVFRNFHLSQYGVVADWKVIGHYENKKDKEGFFYNAGYNWDKGAMMISPKLEGKTISFVTLDGKVNKEIKEIVTALEEKEKNEFKKIVKEVFSGTRKISIFTYGDDYFPKYWATIHDLPRYISAQGVLSEALWLKMKEVGLTTDKDVNEFLPKYNPEKESFNITLSDLLDPWVKEAVEETEEYQQKLKEAKHTGQRVELTRWVEECNDLYIECSTDIVIQYLTPGGKEETERIHTY